MNKTVFLAAGFIALLAPAMAAPQAPDASASARKTRLQPVKSIVQKMSEDAGITVLADSTIATVQVMTPDGETTAANLEDRLDRLVKRLPAGTKWAKVFLPAPENGRRYTPDAVTQFVRAQATLFGKAGESKVGTVEILGRKLADAEAEAYVKGLNLIPVYVLSNLSAQSARVIGGPAAAGEKGSNPIMDALFKQLSVSSPREIPTGNYRVPYTLPDGRVVDANVHVVNEGGAMKISVEVGDGP